MENVDQRQMWEDFGGKKGKSYLSDKYSLGNIVGLAGRAREEAIFRALHLTPTDTLLDVGCASGRQVFKAAEVCARGVGVDIAQSFVDIANEYAKAEGITNTEFIRVEGETMPFKDGEFTRAICSEVVEHIPDPMPLLYEIRRVLAPNGLVVFTVPNLNSRGTLWKRILYGFREPPFTPMTDFSMEGIKEHGDAHVHQFTISRFKTLIESAGFVTEYTGGAAFIDGPKMGRIIELMNRFALMRWLTFGIEQLVERIPLFKYLGRQIVLGARKPA
jgi:ubiquinone/menaquinone biosynthesis C-methylase UbiE